MRIGKWLIPAALMMVALLPSAAMAHEGHDHGDGGFTSGLIHPLTGLDHLTAMIAVGVWAAQMGGRAVVLLPCVLMSAMMAGAGIALQGIAVPLIEPGIVASVLVTGLLIASAAKLPLGAGVIIITFFALFHGAAHGQESGESSPLTFLVGAAIASALLCLVGALAGGGIKARLGAWPVRITGGVFAAAGLLLAAGVL